MSKPGRRTDADRRPPSDRVRRSKDAVLSATFQLLAEKGLGGVSVEAVAARSGVAKTTIYRHWPSRSALLLETCSTLGPRFEVPDSGSLLGDLQDLAATLAARLRSQNFSSVLPSVIDAAERDPEIADVHARVHDALMTPFYRVIDRARGRGELPPDRHASEIVAAVVGPLFYRRWFSREPLDDPFVTGVVERVVAGSVREPAT